MPRASLPPDDPQRQLTVANIDDPAAHHLSIAGGSYTILITGEQTAGRYCLIDLLVPPGGGPPPHRHDFEEMFTLLEGEVELTFRGHTTTARTGTTVNIPANAPHSFRNTSHSPAHLLCLCTPPGQEKFFEAVGDPLPSRTAPPPKLSKEDQDQRKKKAAALAATYRTEML